MVLLVCGYSAQITFIFQIINNDQAITVISGGALILKNMKSVIIFILSFAVLIHYPVTALAETTEITEITAPSPGEAVAEPVASQDANEGLNQETESPVSNSEESTTVLYLSVIVYMLAALFGSIAALAMFFMMK